MSTRERGVEFVGGYDPAVDGYDLAKDPRCLYGWGPAKDAPGPHGCRHISGHGCDRPYRHPGKCMTAVLDPLPCESVQRPKDWDDQQRQECNS